MVLAEAPYTLPASGSIYYIIKIKTGRSTRNVCLFLHVTYHINMYAHTYTYTYTHL